MKPFSYAPAHPLNTTILQDTEQSRSVSNTIPMTLQRKWKNGYNSASRLPDRVTKKTGSGGLKCELIGSFGLKRKQGALITIYFLNKIKIDKHVKTHSENCCSLEINKGTCTLKSNQLIYWFQCGLWLHFCKISNVSVSFHTQNWYYAKIAGKKIYTFWFQSNFVYSLV